MEGRAPDIVVGIGNLLQRDEGVGVEVARRLGAMSLPPHVDVVDGGTAGLGLACLIENRRRVVVADAIVAGQPPGSVFRLNPEQLRPAVQTELSVHDFHLLHALDETRLTGTEPDQVIIFAVQVGDASSGIGLSEPVREAAGRVVALVAEELGLPLVESCCPAASAGNGKATANAASRTYGESMPCQ